jgi:hypothetical protein
LVRPCRGDVTIPEELGQRGQAGAEGQQRVVRMLRMATIRSDDHGATSEHKAAEVSAPLGGGVLPHLLLAG